MPDSLKSNPYILVVVTVLLIFLASCLPGKRTARNIVSRAERPALLVLFPDNIFKRNSSPSDLKKYQRWQPDARDSALYYNSRFIRYMDDSLFMLTYREELLRELRLLRFPVFTAADIDSFLRTPQPAWVFSLAQLQVEETQRAYYDSDVFDDSTVYSRNFLLNVIQAGSWFELSQVNTGDSEMEVLFHSMEMSDALEGDFRRHPFLLEIDYRYTVDSLLPDDIYTLAAWAGSASASCLFNHYLNRSVREKTGNYVPVEFYFFYERPLDRLGIQGFDKFTNLGEE